MECGEETYNACPAHPDRGLDCWKVTGTKCEKGEYEMATITEKVEHCRQCDFYKQFANKI
jgi:hypothetical protein